MSIKTAIAFHDTYERLALSFGYETRKDTRRFDPESPNGKLMIAVCDEIMSTKDAKLEMLLEAVKSHIRGLEAVCTPDSLAWHTRELRKAIAVIEGDEK